MKLSLKVQRQIMIPARFVICDSICFHDNAFTCNGFHHYAYTYNGFHNQSSHRGYKMHGYPLTWKQTYVSRAITSQLAYYTSYKDTAEWSCKHYTTRRV